MLAHKSTGRQVNLQSSALTARLGRLPFSGEKTDTFQSAGFPEYWQTRSSAWRGRSALSLGLKPSRICKMLPEAQSGLGRIESLDLTSRAGSGQTFLAQFRGELLMGTEKK